MGKRAIGIGEEITNGREGSFMRQNLRVEIQVRGPERVSYRVFISWHFSRASA